MNSYNIQSTTTYDESLTFDVLHLSDPIEVARGKLKTIMAKALVDDVMEEDNPDGFNQLKQLTSKIIDSILEVEGINFGLKKLHTHCLYTFYHSIKVSVLSMAIGHNLEFDDNELLELGLSALLHDLGKANIPISILDKPGKLTDSEWRHMKEHSTSSLHYLEKGGVSSAIYSGVKDHHEKFDGSGYPNSLTGKNISLFGRIIAIADVYDALTSNRVYKQEMDPEDGIKVIKASKGSHFDSEIVDMFTNNIIKNTGGTYLRLNKKSPI